MAKWRAWFTTSASTHVDVEADDYEGALEAVETTDVDLPGLCAQCSGWNGPGVDLGEWEPADEKYGPNIELIEGEASDA